MYLFIWPPLLTASTTFICLWIRTAPVGNLWSKLFSFLCTTSSMSQEIKCRIEKAITSVKKHKTNNSSCCFNLLLYGLPSLYNSFILSQIEKLFKYNLYDILLSIYEPYAFVYRVLRLSATMCSFIFLNGTPYIYIHLFMLTVN